MSFLLLFLIKLGGRSKRREGEMRKRRKRSEELEPSACILEILLLYLRVDILYLKKDNHHLS